MRKSKAFWITATVIVVASAISIAVVRYGAQLQKDRDASSIASVQGILAFNHYKAYQEIEQFIEQKCYEQGSAVAEFNKHAQLLLVAEYLRQSKDAGLEKYVRDRDPELMNGPLPTRPTSTPDAVVITPCAPVGNK